MAMDIETKHKMADRVLAILADPPYARVVTDPDTVLADVVQAADMEVSGTAGELVRLWQKSTDKAGFEALFLLLTDTEFGAWLDMAVRGSGG